MARMLEMDLRGAALMVEGFHKLHEDVGKSQPN